MSKEKSYYTQFMKHTCLARMLFDEKPIMFATFVYTKYWIPRD